MCSKVSENSIDRKVPLCNEDIFHQKTHTAASSSFSRLVQKFVSYWTKFANGVIVINIRFQPGLCYSHKVDVVINGKIFEFQGFVDNRS